LNKRIAVYSITNVNFLIRTKILEENLGCKIHYTLQLRVFPNCFRLWQKARNNYHLAYDLGGPTISLFTLALINPRDEVLIPDPCFICYEPSVHLAGRTPVSTQLLKKASFTIDEDPVISHITQDRELL